MAGTKRRLSPEARRAEILQASKELFAEQGYERTQLQQIAARIGASRSIFAPYFNGKEEIYDALFAQWEQMEAETRIRFPLIDDSAVKSLRNAIELLARTTEDEFHAQAGKDLLLDRAIKSRVGSSVHVTRVLHQNDVARYSLQPIFAYGQLTGEFRSGDPLVLAQLLLYLLEGLRGNIQLYHVEASDALIDQILALFLNPLHTEQEAKP